MGNLCYYYNMQTDILIQVKNVILSNEKSYIKDKYIK